MKDKIITGYPHIDRPWRQFYDKDKVDLPIPDTNLTEYLREKCADWGNLTASTYYTKGTTFDTLLHEKVDTATKVLTQLGVKKGDKILNLTPNIPETGELFLGATQIGAVSDFIDPRPDSMDIEANGKKILEIIKHERINFIIALDKCYLGMLKPIEKELKELGIDTIIILDATDSMNLMGKIDYLRDVINYNNLRNIKIADTTIKKLNTYQALLEKAKAMGKGKTLLEEAISASPLRVLKYSDLVEVCKHANFQKDTNLDNLVYIGHTSGTSGSRPKPITITNKNCISNLVQLEASNICFKPKDKVLHVLPYFAPFGVFDNWLLNLISGSNSIDVPEFEANEFGYLLKKHEPNIIMVTPAWAASIPDYSYLQDVDFGFLKKIIYGGGGMTNKDYYRLVEFLKAHGSDAVVEYGHGMSEYCGCGSYGQKEYNIPGSIGVPMTDTIYTIVDPNIEDRLVPVRFKDGEDRLKGELVVSSDAVTGGVLHDDVIVPHYEMDGKSYIRTKDLVTMDRNGVFYFEARKDRSFTRFDGFKVKPFEIEDSILKCPDVKYALVTPYFDANQKGYMPMCSIVLDNNELTLEEQIKIVKDIVYKYIIGNPDMSSRQIPTKFRIRQSIPLTKNNKVDHNAVIKEGLNGTEINVDIMETNLTVSDINIYSSEQVQKRELKK